MRFLFVDRILDSISAEYIRGIKHITADDPYLSLDEEGRPYFITSLVGETLGQLAAWNVMNHNGFSKRPVAGVAASAKLFRLAYVGETLLLESFIDSLDDVAVQYHSIARVGEEIIFTIDGALGPLLPMQDFIDAEDVRRQFAEINRPGQFTAAMPSKSSSNKLGEGLKFIPKNITFDLILESEPGINMKAVKNISRAAPYFPDHFPRKPVLPMTILLECKLNLAREFLKQTNYPTIYKIHEMRRIKMNEFVYPGDRVECLLSVKHQDDKELVLSFRSEVEGKRVCIMELFLKA